MKSEDVVFPRFRNGGKGVLPIEGISVSYKAAAEQLKAEVKRLGLGNISPGSSSRHVGAGGLTRWMDISG